MALPVIGGVVAWSVPFIATAVAFLADAAVGIVGRVLVSLGIGAVTAAGINALLNAALSYVLTADAQVLVALKAVGIDWLIATLFSAITTRAALAGLSSDAVTFWTMRQRIGT